MSFRPRFPYHHRGGGGGRPMGGPRPLFRPVQPLPLPVAMRPTYVQNSTFDLEVVHEFFPRVTAEDDESEVTQACLKRNQELTPGSSEQSALMNLVTKIQSVLEELIVDPTAFEPCQIEEVRQVGSFKKGTMISRKNVADFVIILRTLPTGEAIQALAKRVGEDLVKKDPSYMIQVVLVEPGFEVRSTDAIVRCLIATVPQNVAKLDPEIHLSGDLIVAHLAAIRHARWFEENASNSSVKVVTRLLRDLVRRFDGLSSLNPWCCDLLAHYCVLNTPTREALSLGAALRRALLVLSAGMFLPGSAGIGDACEIDQPRVHATMSLEQQDRLCAHAQTLALVWSAGGHRHVLGLDSAPSPKDMVSKQTVWNGVIVTPQTPIADDDSDEG